MKLRTEKGLLCLTLATISAYLQNLFLPLLLLTVMMLIDYLSGIAQAWISHSLSSRTGILGIIKKVGYLFVVAVAVAIDGIVQVAAENLGNSLQGFCFFGLLVTIWLTINECISVLENLSHMGVPIPVFLLPILQHLKIATEQKGQEKMAELPTTNK